MKIYCKTLKLPKINEGNFSLCEMKQAFLYTLKQVLIKKGINSNLVVAKLF